VVETLNKIEGISCSAADGAFYAFANVEGAIAKLGLENDLAFSEHLLNTVGVAVVPGSAFGLDGHMRISYATAPSVLEDALGRIKKAIEG
jgi:aspartate aminotransferase